MVHKANPISSLTVNHLVQILNTDERIWNNGHVIRVALLSDMLNEDEHWVQWLGLPSIDTFLSKWIEADLIQDWPAPTQLANLTKLLTFVARTPGAIGFTSIQPPRLPPNIRIIPIQEKH
jgi:hypothetical protein